MPGWPSSSCAMESPTGCTKQLISVAARSVPAAEWMRPAGTNPDASACANRASQAARSAGASAAASARATRARTSATLRSSPLAYFSSSTSELMGCEASVATVRAVSTVMRAILFGSACT